MLNKVVYYGRAYEYRVLQRFINEIGVPEIHVELMNLGVIHFEENYWRRLHKIWAKPFNNYKPRQNYVNNK